MIKYKGFIGHFFFDEKTAQFQGNVANSNDIITFQASSISKIQFAFQEAIDEHLEWCKKHRKNLEKPFVHKKICK